MRGPLQAPNAAQIEDPLHRGGQGETLGPHRLTLLVKSLHSNSEKRSSAPSEAVRSWLHDTAKRCCLPRAPRHFTARAISCVRGERREWGQTFPPRNDPGQLVPNPWLLGMEDAVPEAAGAAGGVGCAISVLATYLLPAGLRAAQRGTRSRDRRSGHGGTTARRTRGLADAHRETRTGVRCVPQGNANTRCKDSTAMSGIEMM